MGQITFFNQGSSSSGSITITGFEMWQGAAVITDALPAGVTDDYNPAGLSTARLIRITPNAAGSDLSGVVAQVGHLLTFANLAALGGANLRLLNLNAGSAVANRFTLSGAIFVISPQSSITIIYDPVSLLWRNIT